VSELRCCLSLAGIYLSLYVLLAIEVDVKFCKLFYYFHYPFICIVLETYYKASMLYDSLQPGGHC